MNPKSEGIREILSKYHNPANDKDYLDRNVSAIRSKLLQQIEAKMPKERPVIYKKDLDHSAYVAGYNQSRDLCLEVVRSVLKGEI